MTMKLGRGEPPAGPWRVIPLSEFIPLVFDTDRNSCKRPWVLAVDGRSGGGKTTLADLIHQAVPNSAVIHTDDIAWHHSFFDWSDLLIHGLLKPLWLGNAVSYQPPGWQPHGRSGSIEIAANLDLVIVEGVDASRTEVMPWIDRSVWIQADFDEGKRRCLAREGDTKVVREFWDTWMTEELVFLQRQHPWERANLIVNGSPEQLYNRSTEVIVSSGL